MPDIQIVQFDPVTGLASLALGIAPQVLTGIDLLAQVVALSFMRNSGQNVINPVEGSNLRADIGQYNISESQDTSVLVVQRTKYVEREIISRQTVGVGDPTERLSQLTVLDVAASADGTQVVAKVRVINEAGDQSDLLV